MSEAKSSSELPSWVPWGVRCIYDDVNSSGGFTDARRADAFSKLFHSTELKGWWICLADTSFNAAVWRHLILSIINAVDCAPYGRRATRARPDEKVCILEKQKKAGKLISAAAAKARELADLLAELEENGGDLPAESYSGLALIEAAIGSDRMSRASWQGSFTELEKNWKKLSRAPPSGSAPTEEAAESEKMGREYWSRSFAALRKSKSSYAKSNFPDPYQIIETLAMRFEWFAKGDVFADDPWLSGSHSSWKNYAHVLMSDLRDCKDIYGAAPQFKTAEWTVLLNVILGLSLCPQEVDKGLKDIRKKFWEIIKK